MILRQKHGESSHLGASANQDEDEDEVYEDVQEYFSVDEEEGVLEEGASTNYSHNLIATIDTHN